MNQRLACGWHAGTCHLACYAHTRARAHADLPPPLHHHPGGRRILLAAGVSLSMFWTGCGRATRCFWLQNARAALAHAQTVRVAPVRALCRAVPRCAALCCAPPLPPRHACARCPTSALRPVLPGLARSTPVATSPSTCSPACSCRPRCCPWTWMAGCCASTRSASCWGRGEWGGGARACVRRVLGPVGSWKVASVG